MQKWKFVLLGVTGDLAKLKILPGLVEFANLSSEKLLLRFLGYSRSKPDSKIREFFKQTDFPKNIFSWDCLEGQYDDPNLWVNLTKDLQNQERLVVYVATPPSTFIPIIKNFIDFKDLPIDILIEKPFAQDYTDAVNFSKLIIQNKLQDKLHLVDHYLFKPALNLQKADSNNFQNLKNRTINQIYLQALEKVGTLGRLGYYDKTGAILDMLPSHLLSMLRATFRLLRKNSDLSDFKILDLELGQYSSYLSDNNIKNSTTPTYFKLTASLNPICHKIIIESGKKLGQKNTSINVKIDPNLDSENNHESSLEWCVDPAKSLKFEDTKSTFSLNLTKNQNSDHANLFEAVYAKKFESFVTVEEMLEGWKIYEQSLSFLAQNSRKLKIYKDNLYPFSS